LKRWIRDEREEGSEGGFSGGMGARLEIGQDNDNHDDDEHDESVDNIVPDGGRSIIIVRPGGATLASGAGDVQIEGREIGTSGRSLEASRAR
jgi:hypothetical protein